MKIKITIPIKLKGGETANISFYAELDAPVLSTKIAEIKEPIIEVV